MKTSAAGLELIKRNEGCRLEAYQDIVGVWTIGYGDTLGVEPGMRITQQQAEEGLARRLADEFEPGVMKALRGAPVTQNQFDAMVSLAWNIGVGAFTRSSVARHHREGDYEAASKSFQLWNHAGGKVVKGLTRRRAEEAALYLSEAPIVPAPPVEPIPEEPETESEPIEISAEVLASAVEAMQAATRTVQTMLRATGHYDGKVDGVYGPLTRAAIKEAQK